MSNVLQLPSPHGPLPTFLAQPEGTPKAALIILHEAFAVTPHIQRVCQGYAKEGYICLSPDLFAHQRMAENPENPLWRHTGPMPHLPINKNGLDLARHYISQVAREANLADIDACHAWLGKTHPELPVGIMGYCFGGSMAYFTAANRKGSYATCVAYYGGMMAEMAATMQPACPTLAHFAEEDRYINVETTVEAFTRFHPQAHVCLYTADHGFNRDDGITYNAEAATLARTRTLAFLNQHLAKAV